MSNSDKAENIAEAFEVIRQAMIDDEPNDKGSYAHSWHCHIAMMCYDAMHEAGYTDHGQRHKVANDAASRFMKLCFGVETSQ